MRDSRAPTCDDASKQEQASRRSRDAPFVWGCRLAGSVLLILLVPLILVALGTWLLCAAMLLLMIWTIWCSRGTNVLLITSESPHWHSDIEAHMRPRLPESTMILNWSQRSRWNPLSLRVLAFRFFGGSREFNPQVIVFRPLRWPKCFRFWRAFRDHKHGKHKQLETLMREMFAYLEMTGVSRGASKLN